MPALASENLASLILSEDGDVAWERIIADPRPKLAAFMKAAMAENDSAPLNENLPD
ncbi:hypothetical protein [Prosthecobacter sp.]|jgi:hypothetical protein|uniref:hypothetical protein n=1 Tax=Prosthecobacter sp. TaxID=1965333 RepID=UPI0037C8AD9A